MPPKGAASQNRRRRRGVPEVVCEALVVAPAKSAQKTATVVADSDSEAAVSKNKNKRIQSVDEKVAATLRRDFPWDDHHTKVKECGEPPLPLEARLRQEYQQLPDAKRISKAKLKKYAEMYAPKHISIQYSIRNKLEPLPLALKEALDTFQNNGLRVRGKPPLKLQLSLMTETNQKQVALICEVITKTKASSNPDQAAAICEFARTIKRLDLDKHFPKKLQQSGQSSPWGSLLIWRMKNAIVARFSSSQRTTSLGCLQWCPLKSSRL